MMRRRRRKEQLDNIFTYPQKHYTYYHYKPGVLILHNFTLTNCVDHFNLWSSKVMLKLFVCDNTNVFHCLMHFNGNEDI